jgi:hypothetical protein
MSSSFTPVSCGFQDLLMNLAPVNSNGMVPVSSHPTPASQDPPSDPPSLTFEQYRSPLVNSYYGPNYATLRSNTGLLEIMANIPDRNVRMMIDYSAIVI